MYYHYIYILSTAVSLATVAKALAERLIFLAGAETEGPAVDP